MSIRDMVPWNRHSSNVARRDHQDPFDSLHREMDRLFEDFFTGSRLPTRFGLADNGLQSLSPQVDVVEKKSDYIISAELPGMDEDDIDVTVTDGVLTLTGEKKTEHTEGEEDNPVRIERSYGRFQRRFSLPPDVDVESIKADFSKGVLKLTVPKLPEAQEKTRKISIGKG